MQTRITIEEMQAAARQLARTPRGRAAMARLLDVLEGDAWQLGLLDQHAFLALLGGAWSGQKDKACAVMREALASAGAEQDPRDPQTRGRENG